MKTNNNPRVLAVFTTTRAEFGLLYPLLIALDSESSLEYILFVGGAHLSQAHGQTIDEIQDLGIKISATFDFVKPGNTPWDMAANLTRATAAVSQVFESYEFDMVCFIGDRYEQMAVVMNAILFRKPLIHIHGGEKSEGAIDEQLRHMYTKASHLHFAACQEYADNIVRMGELKENVFNVGALGIDNILKTQLIAKEALFEDLKLNQKKPTALMTYHPSGENSIGSIRSQVDLIFETLGKFDLQVLVTGPNIEAGGEEVLSSILHWSTHHNHVVYVNSLGFQRYLSLVKQVKFVIGNSSSGIIEVPFFRIPTINIGDRQKGRIRHLSILDCEHTESDISRAIETALSKKFIDSLAKMEYQFGDGFAAKRIVDGIVKRNNTNKLLMKSLSFPGDA